MSYSKETLNPLLIEPIEVLVRQKSGGMMIGLSQLTSSLLLSLHKPILSLMINLIPLLLITIPAALLGAELAGIRGILWGVCLSQITIGAVLYSYILGLLKEIEGKQKDAVIPT